PFTATNRRQRVRSATSSLDRFSVSAAVSITGNVASTGTPSARRMVSDLSLLSSASAGILPFSAETLSLIAPIPQRLSNTQYHEPAAAATRWSKRSPDERSDIGE